MAFKTLTIKESTYRKLAACKQPGESFTDVIEREVIERVETAADLLAWGRQHLGRKNALSQRKATRAKAA
jgi:predicted CopG family antitoxin